MWKHIHEETLVLAAVVQLASQVSDRCLECVPGCNEFMKQLCYCIAYMLQLVSLLGGTFMKIAPVVGLAGSSSVSSSTIYSGCAKHIPT